MPSNHNPEQAATIPFRRKGRSVKVCLIRRHDSDVWSVPKGTVDPGETLHETALKESWEEAGLRGRLLGDAIGTFRYSKLGTKLTVAVFLMEVLAHVEDWEEAHIRERRWFSLGEAAERLSGHPVRPLLDRAASLLETS